MPVAAVSHATDPFSALRPEDVDHRWNGLGLDVVSDADLVEMAAVTLSVPRADPADSFVLHAPLELMARTGLLQHVEPGERERARRRIAWLATSYAASGPGCEAVEPAARSTSRAAGTRLDAAVAAGDLDAVDTTARELCATSTAEDLVRALAPTVVPRLSAAAHGSIFLYQLPRLLPRSPAAALMVRGLLRELAREPGWRLHWLDERASAAGPGAGLPPGDLTERLLRPACPGDPGSTFIYPTMSLVDRSGLAVELLDEPTRDLPVSTARRHLLRLAAWSMLQDDPAHAPYGWSHCLTMPQAVLGIAPSCADPGSAVAVAATYVLGFRATLGRVSLDPSWCPEPPAATGAARLLDQGPDEAAATVWHASAAEHPDMVRRLATDAALHPDAHLAKYTLACLDAARDDPQAQRLFTAAAAYLAAWWRARDDGGAPALS